MYFIKKIFSSEWRYGKIILYLGILISISLIAYYNLRFGFIMSPDSFYYSMYADDLIRLNFNLNNFYSSDTFIPNNNPRYTITIPVFLMALSKFIFGTSWQYAFIVLNIILVFLSFILFSKSLLLLNVRPLLIFLAMPILALSVDLLSYPRFVLSDTIFAFFIMLLVFLIVKSIAEKKFNYFFIILVMISLNFTRPTALPYNFAIFIFIFITMYQINYTPKLIILSISILAILITIILATLHNLMELYQNDLPSQFKFILNYANQGIVVLKREETYIQPPPISFFENIYFYLIKIIYFFKFYSVEFSTIHKVLNIFQNLIIFLSIILWFCLKTNTRIINETFLFILFLSLTVAAFHSFTLIDHDWRFRYPLMQPLIMLFPISIEVFLKNNYIK